jgi:hypothetical protein
MRGIGDTMKMKISHNAAAERINDIILSGNILLDKVTGEYLAARDAGTFREEHHIPEWKDQYVDWLHKSLASVQHIFPTPAEAIKLKNAQGRVSIKGGVNVKWAGLTSDLKEKVSTLESIAKSIGEYSIAMTQELFIEEIDSFAKARDINPRQVKGSLPLTLSADQLQTFLGEILGEPLQGQSPEETPAILTTTVKVGGDRVETAVLIKGGATRGKLTLKKCGKDAEEIARLVAVSAQLYIILHGDQIDGRVMQNLRHKIQAMNTEGKSCCMCFVDGPDTARILLAYGKIQL